MTVDMLLMETGNGGDLVFDGTDLVGITGLENQPYLAGCGGNVQAADSNTTEEWCGNALLPVGNPDNAFISTLESALNKYVLNSDGRIKIEAAINNDLSYLLTDVPGTKITVSSSIVSDNRLDMVININGQLFYMEWHPNERFLKYQL